MCHFFPLHTAHSRPVQRLLICMPRNKRSGFGGLGRALDARKTTHGQPPENNEHATCPQQGQSWTAGRPQQERSRDSSLQMTHFLHNVSPYSLNLHPYIPRPETRRKPAHALLRRPRRRLRIRNRMHDRGTTGISKAHTRQRHPRGSGPVQGPFGGLRAGSLFGPLTTAAVSP